MLLVGLSSSQGLLLLLPLGSMSPQLRPPAAPACGWPQGEAEVSADGLRAPGGRREGGPGGPTPREPMFGIGISFQPPSSNLLPMVGLSL